MRLIACATALVLLAGCSRTVPVAVISQNGDIMRGTATAALSGGTFQVAGKVNGVETACSGNYDALDTSQTITMATLCSDGRKGIITATRDNNLLNGSGRVRLNDGTEADFVFGTAAQAF